jgi:hypothetical protein
VKRAGLTVLGLGCEIDRLFAGQPPALPIPVAPSRDDLRDLYEAMIGPTRAGQAVLVIVGDWLPPETLARVHMIRALIGSDRIAIHVTALPPLATSVLAALAAALSERALSVGALAGSLITVADQLPVLAWAGSVAGLRHPSMSLLHHARSVLPWASFVVGVQPEPFVEALSANHDELPNMTGEDPVSLLVAADPEADVDWVKHSVVPAFGGVPVRRLPPTLHGADWWGTSRLIEIVGVPTSLERLADMTLPVSLVQCRWCTEPIAVAPCPICGDLQATGQPRRAVAGAADQFPFDQGA